MAPRQLVLVVGVLIWGALMVAFMMTGKQVFMLLGVLAIIGQVVEPLLYGHSTGLSPFSVIVSATFWTWLWGPIGLILSTPLTLCLVVLGRHVERLEFLDVILGDRPALTPVESFYQRMLAGDPDEAREQAEHLLRDRPLSTYYDEVVLKGLRLAAIDAERGVLTDFQLQRIKSSMQSLIDDLEEHEDREPGTSLRQSLHEWAVVLAVYQSAVERRPISLMDFAPPDDLVDRYRATCGE